MGSRAHSTRVQLRRGIRARRTYTRTRTRSRSQTAPARAGEPAAWRAPSTPHSSSSSSRGSFSLVTAAACA
ncbi:hypothetical protein Z043_102999 [Scleropages formosus]|uniref:Uncharacterized protein n=1 Tax=Scleropages formosus TaxID=113540 RepID=A0A0P7V6K0_SCLFO|nr:hypothetical protein Z043_102999 [Scleropages formosus]